MTDPQREDPREHDEPARDADWRFDPNSPPPAPRSDSRLGLVAEVVRATQAQLAAIASTMTTLEGVIRECADQGMTVDEIAVQASLDRAAVERVLDGSPLFDVTAHPDPC